MRKEMPHIYKLKDDVRHLGRGPQGRITAEKSSVYTVVQQLPIESDGQIRYRIKSQSENLERVVTEDQLSPCR
jgi:ACT domain-containing protein